MSDKKHPAAKHAPAHKPASKAMGEDDVKTAEPKEPAGSHRVSKKIKWADDLIRELEASGTGADKTDIIRRAKAEKFERVAQEKYGGTKVKDLDEKDPELHLSAEEACRILEDDDKCGDITRQKARALLEEGYWQPRPAATLPPPDKDVPPPPDVEPEPMEENDDPVGDGAKETKPGDTGDVNRFPGPKEHGKPGDPGTGERPLDRATAPASADTAGLGRGHESGLPAAPRPGIAEEEKEKGSKDKHHKK